MIRLATVKASLGHNAGQTRKHGHNSECSVPVRQHQRCIAAGHAGGKRLVLQPRVRSTCKCDIKAKLRSQQAGCDDSSAEQALAPADVPRLLARPSARRGHAVSGVGPIAGSVDCSRLFIAVPNTLVPQSGLAEAPSCLSPCRGLRFRPDPLCGAALLNVIAAFLAERDQRAPHSERRILPPRHQRLPPPPSSQHPSPTQPHAGPM